MAVCGAAVPSTVRMEPGDLTSWRICFAGAVFHEGQRVAGLDAGGRSVQAALPNPCSSTSCLPIPWAAQAVTRALCCAPHLVGKAAGDERAEEDGEDLQAREERHRVTRPAGVGAWLRCAAVVGALGGPQAAAANGFSDWH